MSPRNTDPDYNQRHLGIPYRLPRKRPWWLVPIRAWELMRIKLRARRELRRERKRLERGLDR